MERELSPFDRQVVIGFEFLDTPGDEIAPRSNEIGKDFKNQRLRHGRLLPVNCEEYLIVRWSRIESQKGFVTNYGFE
jgi:hypothetical protein